MNTYRVAVLDDIDDVMVVVEDAREFLKLQGNGQWQFGYPNRDDFLNDIKNNQLYVITEDNIIIGCFAITGFEPAYSNLYEGNWISDNEYYVIHRVAIKKEYRGKGYGNKIFEIAKKVAIKNNIHSIRVDTHENNSLLRHLVEKNNYIYCGKVILPPNKDRVVYELII